MWEREENQEVLQGSDYFSQVRIFFEMRRMIALLIGMQ